MDMMAACIVDAMDTGKYLQLARSTEASSAGGRSIPYRALFIRDRQEMQQPGPTYIFTSWARTDERAGDTMKSRTIAKYMSVEVSLDETIHGMTCLATKQWINGLCFFGGEKKTSFVFPWPEALCE